MILTKEKINLLINLCQICVNTYHGKYGKVIPVMRNVQSIDTGRVQVDIGELEDYIIVAFQGSQGLEDWKDNLRFKMKTIETRNGKKIKVHTGFYSQYKKVELNIYDIVSERMVRGKTTVIFTGHSLGGAIATLFAAFSEFNTFCYTFGSPRVGNKRFVEIFKFNVWESVRMVLKGDPVVRVPFALPTLKHLSNWLKPFWMNCRHVPDKLEMKYEGKVNGIERLLSALLWFPRLFLGNFMMHYPQRYIETVVRLLRL